MRLVIDANVLFSAIIKDGMARYLLLYGGYDLCMPEFLLTEVKKHLAFLSKKTNYEKQHLLIVLEQLIQTSKIVVVRSEEIVPFVMKASPICPDPDDVQYLALAMKLNCGLWSNDKKLKEQDAVKVYSTEEISRL